MIVTSNIYESIYDDYLMHHGVKGMKWGIRRKRNKSSSNGNHPSNQFFTQKRQAKLENEYLKKGLPKEEAYKAAQKRIKTEKILMVAGGITVASAVALIAKHQYDYRVDKVIKAGSKLQNISRNSNKGVADAFYASKNKLDNIKYRGLYGDQLRVERNIFGNTTGNLYKVYETKMDVTKDLKVASRKNAKNILKKVINEDSEIKAFLENEFKRGPEGEMIKSGKINNKIYDAINKNLFRHDKNNQKFNDRFYDELRKHGYDAIEDMNDKKYSGYHSKNPLIVFNGSQKAKVNSIRELGAKEISRNKKIGTLDINMKEIAKIVPIYGATLGGSFGASYGFNKLLGKKVMPKMQEQEKKENQRTNQIKGGNHNV